MNKTLLAIVTGLGGMLGWGTADFFAGKTIAKIGNLKTFFWVQFFGFLANIVLFILYLPGSLAFDFGFLPLTFIASFAYLFGYIFLYKAFEKGNLSVVSPISSTNAIFTVLIALLVYKQQLTHLQLPAVIMVIIGVIFVSTNFKELRSGKVSLLAGVAEAMSASVLFGLFFWPVNEYITERTNWIFFNLLIKAIALGLFFLYSKIAWKNIKLSVVPSKLWSPLVLIGALDVIGILSVGYGVAFADSAIVSPIGSAYALTTVVLAMIFLKEKITFTQGFGIALTITGIILTGL